MFSDEIMRHLSHTVFFSNFSVLNFFFLLRWDILYFCNVWWILNFKITNLIFIFHQVGFIFSYSSIHSISMFTRTYAHKHICINTDKYPYTNGTEHAQIYSIKPYIWRQNIYLRKRPLTYMHKKDIDAKDTST